MRGEMLTVFCYDIADNQVRRRVSSILEDHMTRVQYSVFEARMHAKMASDLATRIQKLLRSGDSLRVYAVGSSGEKRSATYGDTPPFDTKEGFWLL
jgi:CRISPR-associated protein Cas2